MQEIIMKPIGYVENNVQNKKDVSWGEDISRIILEKEYYTGLLGLEEFTHATGVDITSDYIEYAAQAAEKEKLNARFICSDIRDVSFENEFDVVLNMADGAVGYLENDEENMKIFSVVSKALKSGGKHFMDIMNGSYAVTHFPCKLWDAGEKCLTLSNFEWNNDTKTLIYGQLDFPYGEPLSEPVMEEGNTIRLYTLDEIKTIFDNLGLKVCESYADFSGKLSSDNDIQLMVYSIKL